MSTVIERRRAEVKRYTALVARLKSDMLCAIETYAQAQVCLGLAHERLELATDKAEGSKS